MYSDTTIGKKRKRRMLLKWFLVGIGLGLALWLTLVYVTKPADVDFIQAEIRDLSMQVFIADDPQERVDGLSVFNALNENQAMVFIFDEPGIHRFWMKDMQFPIDIVWLDSDARVVFIKTDAQPSNYPESYGPESETHYVLEFVSGFTKKYDIQVGDVISTIQNTQR